MSTDLERPKASPATQLLAVFVAVVIGFFVLNAIIGFVITLAKLAVAAVVIVAAFWVINRFTRD